MAASQETGPRASRGGSPELSLAPAPGSWSGKLSRLKTALTLISLKLKVGIERRRGGLGGRRRPRARPTMGAS